MLDPQAHIGAQFRMDRGGIGLHRFYGVEEWRQGIVVHQDAL
jgi:hypothetical protein